MDGPLNVSPDLIGCSPNLDCRIIRSRITIEWNSDRSRSNCWGKKQAYVPRIFSRLGSEGNRNIGNSLTVFQTVCDHPQCKGLCRRESPLSGSAVDGNTRERWNIRNPPAIVLAQKLNLEVKLPRLCHLLHCLQIEFTSLAGFKSSAIAKGPLRSGAIGETSVSRLSFWRISDSTLGVVSRLIYQWLLACRNRSFPLT